MLILNAPTGAEGKTGQRGSVILPVADFDNGIILLTVDGNEFGIDKELVRKGGIPRWFSAGNTEKEPPYSVTLTPQQRSVWQRLTGEPSR